MSTEVDVPPRTTAGKKEWRRPSTTHLKSIWQMNYFEWVVTRATMSPSTYEIHTKDRGPVPTKSVIEDNFFVVTRASLPFLIQAVCYAVKPDYHWPIHVAFGVYILHFIWFLLTSVRRMNTYAVKWGTLDEKSYGRDRTPDEAVNGLGAAISAFILIRIGIVFTIGQYDPAETALTAFSWVYPLKLMAWQLTLDYFFYCYHRLTHDNAWLWSIHSTHHRTKHPSPILAILADTRQECLEVALLPLVTAWLIPMNFHQLYLTMLYVVYIEVLGHSGIRAYWMTPVLGPVLRPFDMEGIVEDHDNHHRLGRSGKNFGKQSRVFDVIFGTVGPRIETLGM